LLADFGIILLYIIGAIIFVGLALLVSSWLSPHHPNEEKLSPYECGEEPSTIAWGQFNSRFYVIGLIFMLFEAELVFLFPWAVIFTKQELVQQTNGTWAWFSFVEILIFILILAFGLVYVWKKGFLDWIKPTKSNVNLTIPINYKAFNDKTNTLTKEKTITSELDLHTTE
jgi:NADH-quinone oxidoreductase subunit A